MNKKYRYKPIPSKSESDEDNEQSSIPDRGSGYSNSIRFENNKTLKFDDEDEKNPFQVSQHNAFSNTGYIRVENNESFNDHTPNSINENNLRVPLDLFNLNDNNNPTKQIQPKKTLGQNNSSHIIDRANNQKKFSKILEYLTDGGKQTILLDSKWLTNFHIYIFLLLIQRDFPEVKGLCNPLYKYIKDALTTRNEGYVFIVNLTDRETEPNLQHWVVISNEDREYFKWKVYDSSDFDLENYKYLFSQILPEKDEIMVKKVNVARQKDGNSCGLYSLANALALAIGISPVEKDWKNEEMYGHFRNCIAIQKAKEFSSNCRKESDSGEYQQLKLKDPL